MRRKREQYRQKKWWNKQWEMLECLGRPLIQFHLLLHLILHKQRDRSWTSQSSLQKPTMTKNLENPIAPNPKTLRLRLRAPLAKVRSRACPPRAPATRQDLGLQMLLTFSRTATCRLEQRKNLDAKLAHLKNINQMSFMLEWIEFYYFIKFNIYLFLYSW